LLSDPHKPAQHLSGADGRHVLQILGHASLESTTVYTPGHPPIDRAHPSQQVLRQGVGSKGTFTGLSKGEKTYTIYRATSTGEAAADVFVAGQRVSKLRLSGF
jgi:hypothetical protein